MDVLIVARDIKVHPALREQVEDLSAGLSRYFHDLRRVAWHLQIEADLVRASCNVAARSGDYRAQATHHTAESAVGLVYDRLVTQRRRVKMKRLGARKSGGAEGRAPASTGGGPVTSDSVDIAQHGGLHDSRPRRGIHAHRSSTLGSVDSRRGTDPAR